MCSLDSPVGGWFSQLFHQFDFQTINYFKKNTSEFEELLTTSFVRWVEYKGKVMLAFPHPKFLLELCSLRFYLSVHQVTSEFVKVFGRDLSVIMFKKLIIEGVPILYPNLSLNVFQLCPKHRVLVEKNGQGLMPVEGVSRKMLFQLQSLVKLFGSYDTKHIHFFHANNFVSPYVDKLIERLQLVTNWLTEDFIKYSEEDNLFQDSSIDLLKMNYSSPIVCGITGFYLMELELDVKVRPLTLYHDVSFFLFGTETLINAAKEKMPSVQFAQQPTLIYLDQYSKYLKPAEKVATGPDFGKNVVIDLKTQSVYSDQNVILTLLRTRHYQLLKKEERQVGIMVEGADGSLNIAQIDARPLTMHLIKRLIKYESDLVLLRAWALMGHFLNESMYGMDMFNQSRYIQFKTILAKINAEITKESKNGLNFYSPTKNERLERNAGLVMLYQQFFDDYDYFLEEGQDIFGMISDGLNSQRKFLTKVDSRMVGFMDLIFSVFSCQEYSMNPSNLFVKDISPEKFIVDLSDNTLDVEVLGLVDEFNRYVDFADNFVEVMAVDVDFVVLKLDEDVEVSSHIQSGEIEIINPVEMAIKDDETKLISTIVNLQDQLDLKDIVNRFDPATMKLTVNKRPLQPAIAKMVELMEKCPELLGKTKYLEFSAGHLGFLEAYIKKNPNLLKFFVTLNTLDENFSLKLRPLNADHSEYINIQKKLLLTSFDFDSPGSMKILSKVIDDKYDLFVWDVSVVMDSNFVHDSLKNYYCGVDQMKTEQINFVSMGRTATRRLLQAYYLLPNVLSYGGVFLMKCQHICFNSSLFPLLSLSSSFEQARLIRLDSSKDTGTEFYFVGIGFVGGPIMPGFKLKWLIDYLGSIIGTSLNNFKKAHDQYLEKKEESMRKKRKKKG